MRSIYILILFSLILASCAECPDGGSIAGGEPPAKYARYCGTSSYGNFTKHGPYKEWYLGTKQLKLVGQFHKGKKNGEWICYSKSGFEVEQEWKNGQLVDGPECTQRALDELSKSMREKAGGK